MAILGLALAIALAAQSAGIALTRKAPETALSLFPLNGLAQEELASSAFSLGSPKGLVPAEVGMPMAEQWALEAYRKEPLSPEAHAILALAERGCKYPLGNREPGFAIEIGGTPGLSGGGSPGTSGTTGLPRGHRDSRSHSTRPGLRDPPSCFPSLIPLFAREGAVDEFARILDGTSPWHEVFFPLRGQRNRRRFPIFSNCASECPSTIQQLDQTLLKESRCRGRARCGLRILTSNYATVISPAIA